MGATAVIWHARKAKGAAGAGKGAGKLTPWLLALLARKPAKLAAVALANKMARIAWKLMVSGQAYDPAPAQPAVAGA